MERSAIRDQPFCSPRPSRLRAEASAFARNSARPSAGEGPGYARPEGRAPSRLRKLCVASYDQSMRPVTMRRELGAILLVAVFLLVALVGGLYFHGRQATSGFGPDWDCVNPGTGEPVCIKRPAGRSNQDGH